MEKLTILLVHITHLYHNARFKKRKPKAHTHIYIYTHTHIYISRHSWFQFPGHYPPTSYTNPLNAELNPI